MDYSYKEIQFLNVLQLKNEKNNKYIKPYIYNIYIYIYIYKYIYIYIYMKTKMLAHKNDLLYNEMWVVEE